MRLLKISSLLLGMVLLTTGCLNLGGDKANISTAMNEMDFFNMYVEELNKTSTQIEGLQANYETNVPIEIKAEDEINFDTSDKTAAEQALADLKTTLLNSSAKIEDTGKQTILESNLQEYAAKYEAYLTVYAETGTYYASQTYKTDITTAATYESQIQQAYANYQTAEQSLFDQIEEYQKTSPYKASLSSEEPAERINASIDYLTDGTEELYNAYMDDWDVVSEPATVREKYNDLVENTDTTVANLNQLDYSDAQVQPIKKYFDDNYLISLNSYLADFEKLFADFDQDLVNEDNIDAYDKPIQNDYSAIIEHHNEIINMTNAALSAGE